MGNDHERLMPYTLTFAADLRRRTQIKKKVLLIRVICANQRQKNAESFARLVAYLLAASNLASS
jgi:hypothetical protein